MRSVPHVWSAAIKRTLPEQSLQIKGSSSQPCSSQVPSRTIFSPERDSIYAATRSVSTMSPPREVREFAPLEKRPPNLVSTQPKTGAGSNNKAAAFQDLKNLMSTSHSGMTHYTCGMCTDRLSLTNKMQGESLPAWIRSQQIMAGQERIVDGTGGGLY